MEPDELFVLVPSLLSFRKESYLSLRVWPPLLPSSLPAPFPSATSVLQSINLKQPLSSLQHPREGETTNRRNCVRPHRNRATNRTCATNGSAQVSGAGSSRSRGLRCRRQYRSPRSTPSLPLLVPDYFLYGPGRSYWCYLRFPRWTMRESGCAAERAALTNRVREGGGGKQKKQIGKEKASRERRTCD